MRRGRREVDARSTRGRCEVDTRSTQGRREVDARSTRGRREVDGRLRTTTDDYGRLLNEYKRLLNEYKRLLNEYKRLLIVRACHTTPSHLAEGGKNGRTTPYRRRRKKRINLRICKAFESEGACSRFKLPEVHPSNTRRTNLKLRQNTFQTF